MSLAKLVSRHLCAAVLAVLGLTACEAGGDPTPSPAQLVTSSAPTASPVAVLIRPGGKYYLDARGDAIPASALAARLRDAASTGRPIETMSLLAEPGVVGYDVVLAMDAAREAGVKRVEGIADYRPGGPNEKRWQQELGPAPASAARDTALAS